MSPPRGIRGFLDGFRSFFEGVGFLARNPRLLPFVMIPFAFTCIVFIVGTIFGAVYLDDLKDLLLPDYTGWLWTTVSWVVFALAAIVLWIFAFVIVGSLISSPFNDYLSQQVERALLPPEQPAAGGLAKMVGDVLRALKQEALRLTLYLIIFAVCVPLLLVPWVGGFVFSVIMTYVSIRYLAWDGLDYCMGRRRWGFRQKMRFLKERRARTVGYGAISFLLLAIPLTTLFVLPMNSVGGSVLFCKIRRGESPGGG